MSGSEPCSGVDEGSWALEGHTNVQAADCGRSEISSLMNGGQLKMAERRISTSDALLGSAL